MSGGVERAYRYCVVGGHSRLRGHTRGWQAPPCVNHSDQSVSTCPVRTILPKVYFDSKGGPTLGTFSIPMEESDCNVSKNCTASRCRNLRNDAFKRVKRIAAMQRIAGPLRFVEPRLLSEKSSYAACASSFAVRIVPSALTSSNRTDTRLEMPDSCIVMP